MRIMVMVRLTRDLRKQEEEGLRDERVSQLNKILDAAILHTDQSDLLNGRNSSLG